MRFFHLLILLLPLCGCRFQDQLILREPVPHEEYHSKRTGTMYQETSYWEIARFVKANNPNPNSHITKTGSVSFSGRKYHKKYDFVHNFKHAKDWSLIFYKDKERQFSIHYNKLGVTFQDVHDQIFIQSHEDQIWDELKDHLYLHQLKDLTESLKSPNFDANKDWNVEVDGLQYFVITRAFNDGEEDIKKEIYFHKKSKSIRRRLDVSLNLGIMKEITFQRYRDIDNSYLPFGLVISLPKQGERVDVNIDKIDIVENARPEGQLKEL